MFLPGYAPELNPDEGVWTNVKADRIACAGVTSTDDLKAKAIGALRRLQKTPHRVRAFLANPHLASINARAVHLLTISVRVSCDPLESGGRADPLTA